MRQKSSVFEEGPNHDSTAVCATCSLTNEAGVLLIALCATYATCVTAQAVILSNLIMGKINGHDQKQNERVLLSAGRTSRAMPFAAMRKDKMRPTMCRCERDAAASFSSHG